jgi:glycosyltransferase involved in cell wall biosynthesis
MEKTLIITPFNPKGVGGAETFTKDFAKALSKVFEVHICTLPQETKKWQGMSYLKSLSMLWKLFFFTRRLVKEYNYKKVYALGLMASFVCVVLRLRFSAVMLALYDFKKPNLFTKILSRADMVFVEGSYGQSEMLTIDLSINKITLFQHWCDQSVFSYKEKNNKRMKVLFVGRPIKIKGKHIIEACQKMTEGIDYEFIENVPYEDLAPHYQMADVVVIPSLYSEGFSRVVIEAASCGCAVIASNRGSLPEMVLPFGKCIEPIPTEFVMQLIKLKFHRENLRKLQMNTAIYALEHFNEKNARVFYEDSLYSI